MGRKGSGVEVREKSIRLSFTAAGQQHRHTLKINGKPAAPTPGNVKYAHRLAGQIRDAIARGTFQLSDFFPDEAPTPASDLTVAKYLPKWLASQRIEASTLHNYRTAVGFWIAAERDEKGAALGALPLVELKADAINTALAARADLAASTLNHYLSKLKAALQAAVDDGLLRENPAARVKAARSIKRPPDPFTQDEVEAILADLRERAEQAWNVVEWWAFTGARTGEVLGLRWQNVDLASGYFEVSESRVRGEHKERTKTGVARRVLMNSRALAAIERQRKHSQAAGSFVWTRPDGQPWADESNFLRAVWGPCLRRLKIRYRRPYNLRHTYATFMLMSGVNPAFGAKQLGHSTKLFLETYSRWLDGDANAREMARMESAFAAAAKATRTG